MEFRSLVTLCRSCPRAARHPLVRLPQVALGYSTRNQHQLLLTTEHLVPIATLRTGRESLQACEGMGSWATAAWKRHIGVQTQPIHLSSSGPSPSKCSMTTYRPGMLQWEKGRQQGDHKAFHGIAHLQCTSRSREAGMVSHTEFQPHGLTAFSDLGRLQTPSHLRAPSKHEKWDKKELTHKMLTQNPINTKYPNQKDWGRLCGQPQSLQHFQTSPSPSQTFRGKIILWIKSPASHLLSSLWCQHSSL